MKKGQQSSYTVAISAPERLSICSHIGINSITITPMDCPIKKEGGKEERCLKKERERVEGRGRERERLRIKNDTLD